MYDNHSYLIDASGNPVTQSVVSVTDSSGNSVTGKLFLNFKTSRTNCYINLKVIHPFSK